MIERYKSKGNKEFFELAESITEVMELYRKLQEIKYPPQKADTVKKWLDHMGDTMFIIFLGPRKQAISKSLLNYLGYDIEELAVEMAKYRHSFLEYF